MALVGLPGLLNGVPSQDPGMTGHHGPPGSLKGFAHLPVNCCPETPQEGTQEQPALVWSSWIGGGGGAAAAGASALAVAVEVA